MSGLSAGYIATSLVELMFLCIKITDKVFKVGYDFHHGSVIMKLEKLKGEVTGSRGKIYFV
jgi:hypothetical protein